VRFLRRTTEACSARTAWNSLSISVRTFLIRATSSPPSACSIEVFRCAVGGSVTHCVDLGRFLFPHAFKCSNSALVVLNSLSISPRMRRERVTGSSSFIFFICLFSARQRDCVRLNGSSNRITRCASCVAAEVSQSDHSLREASPVFFRVTLLVAWQCEE